MQNYNTLQRGFVALELKYNRNRKELVTLKEGLQVQAEDHALKTSELMDELETKNAEIEKLREAVKSMRAVSNMTRQVRGRSTLDCPRVVKAHPACSGFRRTSCQIDVPCLLETAAGAPYVGFTSAHYQKDAHCGQVLVVSM